MTSVPETTKQRPCWFVGASYGGTDDQTARFLREGIWENGYDDEYLDQVKSMRPGDRITIKAVYVQKHNLPFSNRGQSVGAMYIKAVGRITENPGDGLEVKVKWTPVNPPRSWYFSQLRKTVHGVRPGSWKADELISFTFENKAQDIDCFRNDPMWRDKFGDDRKPDGIQPDPDTPDEPDAVDSETLESDVAPDPEPLTLQPYSIDNIMADGCFLERARLEDILESQYRKESLRIGYIYQVYADLRSQESDGDPLSANASGLLLHPSVGEMVDEAVVIQGHAIRFATVDLAVPARAIRSQLLAMASPHPFYME